MPAKSRVKKNLSAMKRARQAEKRSIRNRTVRSSIKTAIKKIESSVSAGKRDDARKALVEAIKKLKSAASKGVIHKNTASRKISRLTRKVNALTEAGAA